MWALIPSECRPRAFASSGERARATSEASSQRLGTPVPPSGRATSSPSLGTGTEEPQLGQVRAFLATPPAYPTPAHARYCLPLPPHLPRGRSRAGLLPFLS